VGFFWAFTAACWYARARQAWRMPSGLRLRASGEVRPVLLGLLTPGYKARDMSIADPHRRPDRDREMSDANTSTTGRAVGPDPLAPGARARAQAMAEFTARGKAFRFQKGQRGNPDGQSRFYHACRKLAREASPEMMAGLIDLAKNAVDERVRSVCLIAVLDRAGVRPIGYDPTIDEAAEGPKFDPSLYSPEELNLIERVLRLMVDRAGG